MDRRDFLTASLMTAAVFKVTPAKAAAPSEAASPAASPLARFAASEAQFRSMIGSRFELTSSEWRGHVRLAEVREGPRAAKLEQFTVVFAPEGTPAPSAGFYEVRHPETGSFPLRIDGRDDVGNRAATFALLR